MIEKINEWLSANQKGWELDPNFITTMRQRGAQYIPPVFRYGAQAALNKDFRTMKSDDEVSDFYRHNPNITIREAMGGRITSQHKTDFEAKHKMPLSDRELLNQTGQLRHESSHTFNDQQLNYGSGAAVFNLATVPTITMNPDSQAYLKMVQELSLPVCAGISGTLDQSTTMAGLVGLGTSLDPQVKQHELETIRLAYLAFMLPGADHTVHEIMQSGKTFGLDYIAGINYEQMLYSADKDRVVQQLQAIMRQQGHQLPAYYFSHEYIKQIQDEFKTEIQNSGKAIKSLKQRLKKMYRKNPHPDLSAKISSYLYHKIIAYFMDETNHNIQDKMALLKPGDSLRLPKEETNLLRTVVVLKDKKGQYQLILETKSKNEFDFKDRDLKSARGAIKKGKPCWRLDTDEPYFALTMTLDSDAPNIDEEIQAIQAESALSTKIQVASGTETICSTQAGPRYEKQGKTKITVYSAQAIGTLDTVLEQLDENQEVKDQLIQDLLTAVKALHAQGYVHQDLKPQNILIYQNSHGNYRLKLTDFGEVRKHADPSQYAAGPEKYQSPELAYYYCNPYDTDKANRTYGETYYKKSKDILGRTVIDNPKAGTVFDPSTPDRNVFKHPHTANDMWAVGLLVHMIQHGSLPQNMHDLTMADKDPLLQGLLKIHREERFSIDDAIASNQALLQSDEGRHYEKKPKGQRYYLAINLKISEDYRVGMAEKLGNVLKRDFSGLPSSAGIKLIDRNRWHITIGWFENADQEDTPISDDLYQQLLQEITALIQQAEQLELQQQDYSLNWAKTDIHANFIDTSGELSKLRHLIKDKVESISHQQVTFKFTKPHAVIARSQNEIDSLKLPKVDSHEKFSFRQLDMNYHDDETGKNVITNTFHLKQKHLFNHVHHFHSSTHHPTTSSCPDTPEKKEDDPRNRKGIK